MIFRTYRSGASCRVSDVHRGQAAASAVCTRSSALGQSPVSSQPDRSSALERASTNSRNPSGSDGRPSTGSTSAEAKALLIPGNPPTTTAKPAGRNNPGGLTCNKRPPAGRNGLLLPPAGCPAARCCRSRPGATAAVPRKALAEVGEAASITRNSASAASVDTGKGPTSSRKPVWHWVQNSRRRVPSGKHQPADAAVRRAGGGSDGARRARLAIHAARPLRPPGFTHASGALSAWRFVSLC